MGRGLGDEEGKVGGGPKFPKGLGLGRPSGLDVPAAERALKKRRVGRRRSVSGGPMEKEPEWIDGDSLPNIEAPIEEEPRPTRTPPPTPTQPARRTRKPSAASRTRTASTTPKRAKVLIPVVKEAPVVKYAETFLNVPLPRTSGKMRSARAKPIERARSEEPDFGEAPVSAPCTQESFGVLKKGDGLKARRVGAKRRLSFST